MEKTNKKSKEINILEELALSDLEKELFSLKKTKTFYKEKDYIRLQPENSTMDPIIVPDCKILGVVGGVFRKL